MGVIKLGFLNPIYKILKVRHLKIPPLMLRHPHKDQMQLSNTMDLKQTFNILVQSHSFNSQGLIWFTSILDLGLQITWTRCCTRSLTLHLSDLIIPMRIIYNLDLGMTPTVTPEWKGRLGVHNHPILQQCLRLAADYHFYHPIL